jgi:hypothetical protein
VLGEGQLQEVMTNMQGLVGGSSRWGVFMLLTLKCYIPHGTMTYTVLLLAACWVMEML